MHNSNFKNVKLIDSGNTSNSNTSTLKLQIRIYIIISEIGLVMIAL